jgi:AcrR family transcriptional regulator
MISDHRTLPRRRGPVLAEAILEAAIAELTEGGYANLTMERVAIKARASKASVYSRWPTRMELVMDVFYHLMPDPTSPPDTGTLRGDLIATFRQIRATALLGPRVRSGTGSARGTSFPDPRTARPRCARRSLQARPPDHGGDQRDERSTRAATSVLDSGDASPAGGRPPRSFAYHFLSQGPQDLRRGHHCHRRLTRSLVSCALWLSCLPIRPELCSP